MALLGRQLVCDRRMPSLPGEGREAALLGGPAGGAGSGGLAKSLSSAPRKEAGGSVLWLSGWAPKSHLSRDSSLADSLPRSRETTGMGPLGELEDIELSGRARTELP